MVEHCKGCDEDLTSIASHASKYAHGDVCANCSEREEIYGDFIAKYGDLYGAQTAAELLDLKISRF